MITIGIFPDRTRKGESYSDGWLDFFKNKEVKVRIVNLFSPTLVDEVRGCDGIMWRYVHTPEHKRIAGTILTTIEHYLRIPVFPDWKTAWHFDEKMAQYYLLQSCSAPTPKTWVFWDRSSALLWADEAEYPKIFKLSTGAGSSNVIMVHSHEQACKLIDRMFYTGIFPEAPEGGHSFSISGLVKEGLRLGSQIKAAAKFGARGMYPSLPTRFWAPQKGYIYFQDFIPNNTFDTRITIIGNRAFGFRRYNRDNDFRASGSGKVVVDPELIDLRCVKIAFGISKLMNFQCMAYDFLFDNESPVINEISYTFVADAVYACPGHWDSGGVWHIGNIRPEHAQAEDFLNYLTAHKE